MKIDDPCPQLLSPIRVDVTHRDLLEKLQLSGDRPAMRKAAKEALAKVENRWRPAAVYRWFEFEQTEAETIGRIRQSAGGHLDIDFGYSMEFLKPASHALVAVYTAGGQLEQLSRRASGNGNLLEAYFIDLIGLAVLEKTGRCITKMAEEKAAASGFGVGPFLSPGSVHGWELEGQKTLCSVLPLEKIGVSVRKDAVLSPFKSISCLIGLGSGYNAARVGATCLVCAKRDSCQMKQAFSSH